MTGGEQVVALAVFAATILLIVARPIEESVAALAGVIALVVLTKYTPLEAFQSIDWNVMAILLGMWIITGYMVKAGFAELVVVSLSKRIRDYRTLVLALMITAGFISMFVDNVLVILLLGSIVLEAAKRVNANGALAILLIGFSANFMGTALLMGDLPPQLLHSIAGAEFLDFVWSRGRPSSFPLLTVTFIVVTLAMYTIFLRHEPRNPPEIPSRIIASRNRFILAVSVSFFAATVAGMAARPLLGVPLGFITLSGATGLALVAEAYERLLGRRGEFSFEEVLKTVEWRALLFYASLFSLVGGLEETGVIKSFAELFLPFVSSSPFLSYTVFYWAVAGLATIVEHDALLLTFLYLVRDAAALSGSNVWPLYWGMAWSATLASNATTAAAPALYVAVSLAEKHGYSVRPRVFLKYSLVYAAISLLVHYAISTPIWAH